MYRCGTSSNWAPRAATVGAARQGSRPCQSQRPRGGHRVRQSSSCRQKGPAMDRSPGRRTDASHGNRQGIEHRLNRLAEQPITSSAAGCSTTVPCSWFLRHAIPARICPPGAAAASVMAPALDGLQPLFPVLLAVVRPACGSAESSGCRGGSPSAGTRRSQPPLMRPGAGCPAGHRSRTC